MRILNLIARTCDAA